jgi:hypothetical protein
VQAANSLLRRRPDKQQLEPMLGELAALPANLGRPKTMLGDNGYFSAANVTACAAAEIAPLLAPGLTPHHPSLARMLSSPRPPPSNISWCDRVIAACPSAISCASVIS